MLETVTVRDRAKRKDSLNRALFSSHTQTPTRGFLPENTHLRAMAFLHRHTMASSDTLYELLRSTVGLRNRHNFSEWLKTLFDGRMVFKPEAQQNTKNPDSHFHIYELTTQGQRELERRGLLVPVIRHSGPFRHQLMGATITGMKDIMCQRAGYRYIPAAEVLARLPAVTTETDKAGFVHVPFDWHGKLVDDKRHTGFIPDMVDAIDYRNRFVVYIDEYNCHTETLAPPKDFRKRSVYKTIKQMERFVGRDGYKQAYRLNAPAIFTYYTVNAEHAANIVGLVAKEIGKCPWLAVGVERSFSTPFKPPRMPVHLFEQGLTRAGLKPWIVGKLPA